MSKALAEAILTVRGQNRDDIPSKRQYIVSRFPDTMKALQKIDYEISCPKRRKGFNLVKIESKKHGFLYYVRFSHDGKMLPSKWNTHTNKLEEAELFAQANKARLVDLYLSKKDGRMYKFLEEIGRSADYNRLTDLSKKVYLSVVENKFIPFLKRERIASFDQITTPILIKFQDQLLTGGLKPQTVNSDLKKVRKVFTVMMKKGLLDKNPFDVLKALPVKEDDRAPRGCYELDRVKGVFNRRWKDELSYLLCLFIYTTGMRNTEINNFKMEDIKTIGGIRFIDIKKSKTLSGKRLVPLNDTLYRNLAAWAAKTNKNPDSPLIGVSKRLFETANAELAKLLKASDEELKRENISFYSGRHYWKTLMNSEGLGEDIEEIFMGHKVSGDVKKLYNHMDKRGQKQTTKKARQVFSILDRCLFNKKPKP